MALGVAPAGRSRGTIAAGSSSSDEDVGSSGIATAKPGSALRSLPVVGVNFGLAVVGLGGEGVERVANGRLAPIRTIRGRWASLVGGSNVTAAVTVTQP